ncbi:MAG: cytochrome c oxidase assembly protein [Burkholderiales bacterium]
MSAQQANRMLLKKLLVVAVAMFGFGFALVPFYKKICEVTGINNIFQADALAKNTQVDPTRTVTVELDANTRQLAWSFRPLLGSVKVHPGELTQVVYEARNTLPYAVTGQAIPSYGPQYAAEYFRKLECFCFTQQTLKANEVRQMPVVFVIDPKLPKEVSTITLSYTFFEVEGGRRQPG